MTGADEGAMVSAEVIRCLTDLRPATADTTEPPDRFDSESPGREPEPKPVGDSTASGPGSALRGMIRATLPSLTAAGQGVVHP